MAFSFKNNLRMRRNGQAAEFSFHHHHRLSPPAPNISVLAHPVRELHTGAKKEKRLLAQRNGNFQRQAPTKIFVPVNSAVLPIHKDLPAFYYAIQ